MTTDHLVLTYVLYASVAVPLVVWLSVTLTRNGAVFLADVFDDRRELAAAVNHLLAIGFLLLNLGYALLLLTANGGAVTLLEAVELLVRKLGLLLFSLGLIHFANMLVFWHIGRRDEAPSIPVAPTIVQQAPPHAPHA